MAAAPREDDDPRSYGYYDRIRASLLHDDSPWRVTVGRPTESDSSSSKLGPTDDEPEKSTILELEHRHNATEPRLRLMHLSVSKRFSHDNPQIFPFALSLVRSALLAQHHFNNRIDTVVTNLHDVVSPQCNLRMTLDFFDGTGTARTAVEQFVNEIEPRPFPYQTTAMVGPSSSRIAVAIGVVTSARRVPQIASAVTSPALDEEGPYSYFGRVMPSAHIGADGAIDYYHQVLKTTHLGILYSDEEFGSGFRLAVEQRAQEYGIVTQSVPIKFSLVPNDPEAYASAQRAVEFLHGLRYRHFFGAAFTQHWDLVYQVSRANPNISVVGPENFWMWVGVNPTINQDWAMPLSFGPAVGGHGDSFVYLGMSDEGFERHKPEFLALNNDTAFHEYFATKSPVGANFQFPPNITFSAPLQTAELMYDAVMSLGIAGCGVPQEEPFFTGPQLYKSFLQSNFSGATGEVQVDPVTGTRKPSTVSLVMVNQVQQSEAPEGFVRYIFRLVAQYKGGVKPNPGTWSIPSDAFRYNYSDYTYTRPPPLPLPDIKTLPDSTTYNIFCYLAGLVILGSIGFALWTWKNRKHKVVRASQPYFLLIVCAGEFMIGMAVMAAGATDPPFSWEFANFCCMATPWLFVVGFSLVFAALLTKTLRINKLFEGSRSFRRVTVSIKDASMPGILLVSVNVCLLLAWQVTDPLRYEPEMDETGSVDEFGRLLDVVRNCNGRDGLGYYFSSATVVVMTITMITTTVHAYKGRNITSEYSESTQIGMSIVVNFQALALALPVFFFDTNPQTTFISRSILLLVVSSSTLLLVFAPKVWRRDEHDRQVQQKQNEKQRRLELLRKKAIHGHSRDRSTHHFGEKRSILLEPPARTPAPLPHPKIVVAAASSKQTITDVSTVTMFEGSQKLVTFAEDLSLPPGEEDRSLAGENSSNFNSDINNAVTPSTGEFEEADIEKETSDTHPFLVPNFNPPDALSLTMVPDAKEMPIVVEETTESCRDEERDAEAFPSNDNVASDTLSSKNTADIVFDSTVREGEEAQLKTVVTPETSALETDAEAFPSNGNVPTDACTTKNTEDIVFDSPVRQGEEAQLKTVATPETSGFETDAVPSNDNVPSDTHTSKNTADIVFDSPAKRDEGGQLKAIATPEASAFEAIPQHETTPPPSSLISNTGSRERSVVDVKDSSMTNDHARVSVPPTLTFHGPFGRPLRSTDRNSLSHELGGGLFSSVEWGHSSVTASQIEFVSQCEEAANTYRPIRFLVDAPAGYLGLVFADVANDHGPPVVQSICGNQLANLAVGDRILSVDGVDTRFMTVEDLDDLIEATSHRDRGFLVERIVGKDSADDIPP